MEAQFVKLGDRLINLSSVADVKRHDGAVYLNMIGGGYVKLEGKRAERVVRLIEARAMDLGTGERMNGSE